MSNTAVTGRVMDDIGSARPRLTVRVYDNDVWPFRDLLGQATTGAYRQCTVTYPAASHGPTERLHDIGVDVRQGGSVVVPTKETSDVAEDFLDLDDLQITGKTISVQGRVVDATDLPISGLIVIATDIDTVTKDDVLGRAVTNGDEALSLSYPPSLYEEALGDRPDIVVTVLYGGSDTRGDFRDPARVTFLVGV